MDKRDIELAKEVLEQSRDKYQYELDDRKDQMLSVFDCIEYDGSEMVLVGIKRNGKAFKLHIVKVNDSDTKKIIDRLFLKKKEIVYLKDLFIGSGLSPKQIEETIKKRKMRMDDIINGLMMSNDEKKILFKYKTKWVKFNKIIPVLDLMDAINLREMMSTAEFLKKWKENLQP